MSPPRTHEVCWRDLRTIDSERPAMAGGLLKIKSPAMPQHKAHRITQKE